MASSGSYRHSSSGAPSRLSTKIEKQNSGAYATPKASAKSRIPASPSTGGGFRRSSSGPLPAQPRASADAGGMFNFSSFFFSLDFSRLFWLCLPWDGSWGSEIFLIDIVSTCILEMPRSIWLTWVLKEQFWFVLLASLLYNAMEECALAISNYLCTPVY